MKHLFFIFLFLILSAGSISAATLSGSPSSLNFNLEVGEENCLIFVVSSNDYSGDLNSIMKWAEKDAEVSSPNDFILNNSEIDLSIVYSLESIINFDGEEEIQVCISGSEEGYWRGSLEYRTDSEGNIGVGVGTWLRVNITEKSTVSEEPQTQIPPASSNSNPSGGGGSSIKATNNSEEITINNSKESEVPLGELEEESEEQNSGFFRATGSTISNLAGTKAGKGIGIVIIAIMIIAMIFFTYKRRQKI